MSTGPDFLIIGAMKAATSTLHEQLARQDGIFMTRPKEPNFFSDDEAYARGIEWYRSLFAAAPPGSLCGESSTHYTKLPTYPATVERMALHLGSAVRFVYVIRHPVERLVSQYIHEWTVGRIEEPLEESIDRHPELVDYSRYAMQLEPYVRRFGTDSILVVLFEALCARPRGELERVCDFVGCERAPRWDESLPPQNVSAERLRRSPLRDALLNAPGMPALRRALVPRFLRERIKRRWRMVDRPHLSAQRQARLIALFDQDLARLSEWFGLDLTCESLAQMRRGTAAERPP
jgi:hypothetical protein